MDTRFSRRIELLVEVDAEINGSAGQKISLASGNKFHAKVVDISESGIGMIIKSYLPKGVIIKLKIGGAPFNINTDIEVKGEICYCRNVDKDTYRCGLKFLNLPEEWRAAIAQFISMYDRRKEQRFDVSE